MSGLALLGIIVAALAALDIAAARLGVDSRISSEDGRNRPSLIA